jgi:pimeloyl-ACP methyl ester carboxylesterase
MRHLIGRVAFVAALLVAATAAPPSPAAAASESEIAWEACPLPEVPARECGSLTVPLDYDEPAGPTISIAVARVPATDQAGRIGSLITNPGGPGGSGVEGLALMYAALPEPLPAQFDVVGFDPRGVGQSAPVHCFESVAERTAFFAAIPTVPIGAEEIAAYDEVHDHILKLADLLSAGIMQQFSDQFA